MTYFVSIIKLKANIIPVLPKSVKTLDLSSQDETKSKSHELYQTLISPPVSRMIKECCCCKKTDLFGIQLKMLSLIVRNPIYECLLCRQKCPLSDPICHQTQESKMIHIPTLIKRIHTGRNNAKGFLLPGQGFSWQSTDMVPSKEPDIAEIKTT